MAAWTAAGADGAASSLIDAGLLQRQSAEAVGGRLGAAAVRRRCMVGADLTWRRGTAMARRARRGASKCRSRVSGREPGEEPPPSCRAPRCSSPPILEVAPTALLHNLKHNKVLHEHNVILTVDHRATRRASLDDREGADRRLSATCSRG